MQDGFLNALPPLINPVNTEGHYIFQTLHGFSQPPRQAIQQEEIRLEFFPLYAGIPGDGTDSAA